MLTPSLIVPAEVNSIANEQAYPPSLQDDPTTQKIACGAIAAENRDDHAQEKVGRKTARSTCACSRRYAQLIGCCGGNPWYMDSW
jgi:hypothetical protein